MKHQAKMILSTSAASMLALTVLSQGTPAASMREQDAANQSMYDARQQLITGTAKVTDVIGRGVENNQHEALGKVANLALDIKTARIVQVILSTGGGNYTAVPPEALHTTANKMFRLNISVEKFRAAPPFAFSQLQDSQSNNVVDMYAYYGEQPYFVTAHDGYWTANTNGTFSRTAADQMNESSDMDKTNHVGAVRPIVDTSNTISTRNPDGTRTRDYYSSENGAISTWSRLGEAQKATKILGMPVRNLQNKKLGKVDNIYVDLAAGRIAGVIIVSGGFMGIERQYNSAPATALQLISDNTSLLLDISPEMFAVSPTYAANEWQNATLPGYTHGSYYPYRVEPYNNIDAPSFTNNAREHDNLAMPQLAQGYSQSDMTTTAQIRYEIIADKGISMNAKQVEVITQNGQVTLRGTVNTDTERRLIGEIADGIPHTGTVDNQLTVQ